MASQWVEDHEYLVAVVTWGEPECGGPAANLCPAEPAVETLQPGAATSGEVKLLQTHLRAANLPGVRHKGTSDSLAAASREGLQMADGAPMRDDRMGIAVEVYPAGQGLAGPRDEEPAAARIEAGDEPVGRRRDVGGVDGRKREPNRPASVTDGDPAVDKFLSQAGAYLVRTGQLVDSRINKLVHTGSLPDRSEGTLLSAADSVRLRRSRYARH